MNIKSQPESRVFTNSRSLHAYCNENLSTEELTYFANSAKQILDDRLAEEAEVNKQSEEKQAILNQYREMLAADGISLEELINSTEKTTKKRNPRPPKYKYQGDEGFEKSWTGQGRTPREMQRAIDNGSKLEEFLI